MENLIKGQIVADRKLGILYSVYGINNKSKTYHIRTIFVPEGIASSTMAKYGDKFNVPFRKICNYSLVNDMSKQANQLEALIKSEQAIQDGNITTAQTILLNAINQ